MQPAGIRGKRIQNFLISLSGHAFCLFLLIGVPSCGAFRHKKPEHKIYTFDLINPALLSMKKTQVPPASMGKTAAPPEPAVKVSQKKEARKKEAPKKEKKAEPPKKEKKAAKEKARKAPAFALPKKTIEEKIKEQLKKIEDQGAKEWVEADRAEELAKPASRGKVAEQGIAGLLDTGDFANISYSDAVASMIYQTWQPPSKTPADREGVTVVVRFKIMRDGKVMNPRVEKKSGIEVLDASALQALKDAELPPLPDDYKGDSLEVCMTFVPIPEEKT